MFSLDNQSNDLWTGGPWEQPAPKYPAPPAVSLPGGGKKTGRPVLRTKKKRRFSPFRIALVALSILTLISLSVAVGLVLPTLLSPYDLELPNAPSRDITQPPLIQTAPTGTGVTLELCPPGDTPLSYTQIYEQNARSVVSIRIRTETGYGTGTGVIMTQDGYLVTNAHVVAGALEVEVSTWDNRALPASLVGFDAGEDLAVLKIEATGLTPAQFGDSFQLRCGDPVAALGDPLGYRSTITNGIVSATDREVEVDDSTMTLIQTSAAINFGNSGGALLNQYGQVVGITTIKIVTQDGSAEALGFAIPSQRVKYVVDTLMDGREVRPGVFGFRVFTTVAEGGGLELESVDMHSDVWAKGLRAGDVILSVNGQPINAPQDLSRVKLPLGVGDTVSITYRRDGATHTVEAQLVDPARIS